MRTGRVIVTLKGRVFMKATAAAGLVLIAAACTDSPVAPAVCPEYCPVAQLVVVDSILPASVVRDTSYVGYVKPNEASEMQVALDDSVVSRGVVRFGAFPEEILIEGTGLSGAVVATDSFELQLFVSKRSAATESTEIVVHRLPVEVDSATTYAQLEPYFDDSTVVGTLELSDTLIAGTVSTIIPGDAFPTLADDSLVAAVGLAYDSVQAGFADIVTVDSAFQSIIMIRYAQVDSAGEATVQASDTTSARFDTFLFTAFPAPDANSLTVGSAPANRTLLSLNLPTQILDSSSIVRATLLLVPSEPVVGVTGDSLVIVAQALAADVGPKSPTVSLTSGVEGAGIAVVPAGSTDTVRVEITHLLRAWATSSGLPRALSLRALSEAGSLCEARFHSSRSTIGVPSLQVSYVPPVLFQFGGGQ
jgi:hypothetical protein